MAIIGVVAAITIPTLINAYQNKQFKAAYKKAYSDLNQVLFSAMAYNEMPYRRSKFENEVTSKEWQIIKSGLKISKECQRRDLYSCWAKGDTLCGGSCTSGNPDDGLDMDNGVPGNSASSFMDISGRSWAQYNDTENIYLVDTNGFSDPNQFGKDRWIFTFADKNDDRISKGYPVKVIPYYKRDLLNRSSFCKHPPCYYYSWLYEN